MSQCPNRCGALTAAEYEEVQVDYCPACHGAWLDYGKLSRIIKNRQRTWSADRVRRVLAKLDGYNTPPMPEGRELLCPACEVTLDEVNYQGTSNIIVNPCPVLHGLWLDAGEIATIQIYMEHWSDYAREHADEIGESVQKVTAQLQASIDAKLIEDGVASSSAANRLVFETLELLEQWRNAG